MPTRTDPGALPAEVDVAVIGGGPAGLAAATRLKQRGVAAVAVLDREPAAGPDYAQRLIARTADAGVAIHAATTVVRIEAGPRLLLSTANGSASLAARRVLLATGVRETSRAARLIGGQRPLGVVSTGALQSMVYLAAQRPFKRPVILGSELVSFSAILTCRHAGIRPVAMIEEGDRVTARRFAAALPRLLGMPLLLGAKLVRIHGGARVEGITLRDKHGAEQEIETDGVIVTGGFTPEATLLRMGHLQVDRGSGGPVVDQFGRCSDPDFFAAGNLLRPVETAGWSWQEGKAAGDAIADSLAGSLPRPQRLIAVEAADPAIKFVLPQRLVPPPAARGMDHFQLRLNRAASGRLTLRAGSRVLWSQAVDSLPERRILVPLSCLDPTEESDILTFGFAETA